VIDYYQNQKEEQRKRKRRKWRIFLFSFVFVVVIVGIAFFMNSSFFQIREVRIEGTKTLDQALLKEGLAKFDKERSWISRLIIPQNSTIIPYLEGSKISSVLKENNYPIRNIEIKTSLSKKTVDIKITERDRFALWCKEKENTQCWWMDNDGFLFVEGPHTEGGLIKKIVDYSDVEVLPGKYPLDKDYSQRVVEIFNFLENKNIAIQTLVFKSPELAQIDTYTQESYPVFYFSLRHSPSFASKTIDELKDKFSKIEYIDLTVNNRVYYK
jgi:hypothetical protein